jgi:mRNA interferase MazF
MFPILTNGLARRASNQLAEKLPIRPVVEASDGNGLRIGSQVMTDRMLAVPREHVPRVIGTVDPETRGQLNTALPIVLGLARY